MATVKEILDYISKNDKMPEVKFLGTKKISETNTGVIVTITIDKGFIGVGVKFNGVDKKIWFHDISKHENNVRKYMKNLEII